jgi:predicted Ser/Thr protein kinase/tetratricopeptide (TPR) repeat protein
MDLPAEERRVRLDRARLDDPGVVEEVETLLGYRERERAADAGPGLRGPVIATGVLNVGALIVGSPDDPTGGLGTLGQDAASSTPIGSALASTARYTIQRVLGEGGMGTVYLAEQDRPRRTVALKVMRAAVANAASMRRRFELEANLLGRLEHPGIARIYDAGVASVTTDSGTATVPYFAMEYIDGLPLHRHCDERSLGTRERMALVAQIAEAVAVAHRHGVVHRDLKPANILVDRSGRAKVLDFGVARATLDPVGGVLGVTTQHTDMGQLIGTLGYMSPEQVGGDSSKIGVQSDVYALGAIAYELLAGQPLVDARTKSIAEVARVIQLDEPRALSSFNRVFRGDLETIVAKAIEKDPGRRYADAGALAEDIGRYLRDEPVVARPATTLYQISKFAQRNRGLVGGVIATIVVLLVGLVATSAAMFKAFEAQSLAESERTKAEDALRLAEERRTAAVEAQARADNRFGQLRKLAKTFVYDFHDMIVDLPGSLEARKKLVSTALEYLDGLAAEQSEDIDLQNELSEAYLRVGQVQGYGSRANLGDREGAMVSFRKALAVREAALARQPDHRLTLDGICIIRNQIAGLIAANGDPETALTEYERVLADRLRLADAEPNNAKFRYAVSVCHQWIGNMHRQIADRLGRERAAEQDKAAAEAIAAKERERLDRALTSFREQLAVAKAVAAMDEELVARAIPVAHEKIGDVLRDRGENDAAIVEYEQSLAFRERRMERKPDNAEARTDVMASLSKIGASLLNLNRFADADAYLSRSHALALTAVAQQPDDHLARTNLVVSLTRRAQVKSSLAEEAGKSDATRVEALRLAEEGLAAAKEALDLLNAMQAEGKLEPAKKPWIDIAGQLVQDCEAVRVRVGGGSQSGDD